MASLHFKTRLFVCIVVLANVAGNTLLSAAMRKMGVTGFDPSAYLALLLHPAAAGGVVLLALGMLFQMALLSWADLTYILPVTALGYVLTAVSGKFLLHDAVPPDHWIGILLISTGVALVSQTPPRGTEW